MQCTDDYFIYYRAQEYVAELESLKVFYTDLLLT